MIVGTIMHLGTDETNPGAEQPIVTINHVSDDTVIPVTIIQGSESIWLGTQQAREFAQLLADELGETFEPSETPKRVLAK